jgi:hypothetical protein
MSIEYDNKKLLLTDLERHLAWVWIVGFSNSRITVNISSIAGLRYKIIWSTLKILCTCALHTALNRIMPIFLTYLCLRMVRQFSGLF